MWTWDDMRIARICVLVMSLFLGGCNLPARSDQEPDSSGLIYTAAAQTIVARVTEEARNLPVDVANPPLTIEQPVTVPWTPEPTFTETPTSTSTPTPTPTSTPIQEAILVDDFSNTTLWYVSQEDKYGFEYQDGGYRIYNQIVNGAIWSIRGFQYNDIQVEVDAVRQDGPEEGYFGVVCRLGNDGEDYYALVIGDNGFYGILKMYSGESGFLETGLDDQDIIQRGLGKMNRVSGECSGNRLALSVNGKVLLTVNDESLASGDVGLVVGNRLSGSGIDVLFDNFALIGP